jgi:hypothetical protein
MSKEALVKFKGLLHDAERAELAENLRTSLFNEDLSKDTTFSQIHLVIKCL